VQAVLIAAVFLSGCNKSSCGDEICQSLEERKGSCPQDCVIEGIVS